jgi:APA family basic amino acid/polyamine antiporter
MAVTVAFMLVCLATNAFEDLLAVAAFLYVANYMPTFAGFFVSRRREPLARRPFRVPWYPVVPGVALGGSVAFLIAAVVADPVHSTAALALVALSWPAYRLAARRGKE